MNLRNTIETVLDDYKTSQFDMANKASRKMLADQLYDTIQSKYVIAERRDKSIHEFYNQEPGVEY